MMIPPDRVLPTVVLGLLTAVLIVACSGPTSPQWAATVDDLRLNTAAVTLDVGGAAQLTVSAVNPVGNTIPPSRLPPVAWRSTRPEVVSVTSAGALTGLKPGNAKVTASAGGRSVSAQVAVLGSAPSEAPLAITTVDLPAAVTGIPYSRTLEAVGGESTRRWEIAEGSLPTGVRLDATSGRVSGIPADAGTVSFTVQVRSGEQTARRLLSLETFDPPSITTASLPGATVGAGYSETLEAAGGNNSYTWSMVSGELPQGIALGPSTGRLSGVPSTPGSFGVTLGVTSVGVTETRDFTISVGSTSFPPPTITTPSLPDARVGVFYERTLGATGGDGTYRWTISFGVLPPGLSLEESTGVISGTPRADGSFVVDLRLTSAGISDTRRFSLRVLSDGPSVSITTTDLPAANVGSDYAQTLTASGGDGTYQWVVVGGALPGGLSLDSSGTISGSPGAPGQFAFRVGVASGGSTAERDFTLTVTPGAVPPPPPPPSGGSLLLDENWNYSSTADLLANPRHNDSFTRGNGQIRLATGLGSTPWGGTTAVRRFWPTGLAGAPQVGLGVTIPDADEIRPTELWIEIYANFGGHTQGGRTGDKVLFLQDEDYNRWDLMQNVGTRIVSSGGNVGIWNDGRNPNWSRGTYPSGGNFDFASQMVGVDRWYRLRFHARMGRGDGSGSFTAWVDGTRVFQASGGNTNESGDYFRYIQIGANSAAGPGAYQDFGRLRVYTSNPGW
jgi:hypothetical protein